MKLPCLSHRLSPSLKNLLLEGAFVKEGAGRPWTEGATFSPELHARMPCRVHDR